MEISTNMQKQMNNINTQDSKNQRGMYNTLDEYISRWSTDKEKN